MSWIRNWKQSIDEADVRKLRNTASMRQTQENWRAYCVAMVNLSYEHNFADLQNRICRAPLGPKDTKRKYLGQLRVENTGTSLIFWADERVLAQIIFDEKSQGQSTMQLVLPYDNGYGDHQPYLGAYNSEGFARYLLNFIDAKGP